MQFRHLFCIALRIYRLTQSFFQTDLDSVKKENYMKTMYVFDDSSYFNRMHER